MCERHEVLLTTGKLCDHACSRLLLLRRLMKKSKNINKWKLLQKIVCLADLWCWQVTNVTHFDISTYKLKSLLQLLIIKQLFYNFWKIKLQFDKNFVKAKVLLNKLPKSWFHEIFFQPYHFLFWFLYSFWKTDKNFAKL